MSEYELDHEKLLKELQDANLSFFEMMGMIIRADAEGRKHMGLRPDKFEEYVTRLYKRFAAEKEKKTQAFEKKYPLPDDGDEE